MAVTKWMQGAVNPKHQGMLRAHFGVKAGQDIPPGKIDAQIASLQAKVKGGAKLSASELKLLHQLLFARNARKANAS